MVALIIVMPATAVHGVAKRELQGSQHGLCELLGPDSSLKVVNAAVMSRLRSGCRVCCCHPELSIDKWVATAEHRTWTRERDFCRPPG